MVQSAFRGLTHRGHKCSRSVRCLERTGLAVVKNSPLRGQLVLARELEVERFRNGAVGDTSQFRYGPITRRRRIEVAVFLCQPDDEPRNVSTLCFVAVDSRKASSLSEPSVGRRMTAIPTEPRCVHLRPSVRNERERRHPKAPTSEELPP
jgi:hypothetical protein